MVSHDERLVELISNELWMCKEGQVRPLTGGLDEYKNIVATELQQQKS